MKLRHLNATFIKLESEKGAFAMTGEKLSSDTQGICFLCPLCFATNHGEVGTHSVICWFHGRGVPDELDPKPGRWNPSGSSIDDLTFVPPGMTSVLLTGGCGWHGFVKNGDAT
jgi:hypothetical protein